MDVTQRTPSDPAAFERHLEAARAEDLKHDVDAQTDALPPVPPAVPEAYKRKLRRVGRALFLGLSIVVGRTWKPELGSALADAVDGPAEELSEELSAMLSGRLNSTLTFVAIAAAWADKALTLHAAKLHELATAKPRPTNVHDLHQPAAPTTESSNG